MWGWAQYYIVNLTISKKRGLKFQKTTTIWKHFSLPTNKLHILKYNLNQIRTWQQWKHFEMMLPNYQKLHISKKYSGQRLPKYLVGEVKKCDLSVRLIGCLAKCTLLPFCTWLHYWMLCILLSTLWGPPPKNISLWALFLETFWGASS